MFSILDKASECDETSRTTYSTPPATSLSIKLLSSKDSGVVNPVLIILLGDTNPKVPILPLL